VRDDDRRSGRRDPGAEPQPGTPVLVSAAVITATVAFTAYTTTLLPGVDLGDTGGFQAAVLWPETSARRSYPLYYALARLFVATLSADNPARGLNLFSAVTAAAAAGLLAYISGRVTRSAVAGAAAGLLLAFSYTFWTQAIIAEVYALHLTLVASCLVALYVYARRPTTSRLALFFGIYALSFGNHLSMILLLVPFAWFLWRAVPTRTALLEGRILTLACAAALAGALLYVPNLLFVWTNIDAPAGWAERFAVFWFDTTKADWRQSMVLGVSASDLRARAAMWAWDARQQFGLPGIALAIAGIVRLWWLSRPWALLVVSAYMISTIFAFTYNVGDPHVFFLPGHFFTAFAVAAAAAPSTRPRRAIGWHLLSATIVLYAGWRALETWPRVDRHDDRRADVIVARLTTGINDGNAVLVSALDWQSENALLYAGRYEQPAVAWTRLADVMLHLPFFVADNHRIGRDIVLTSNAAAQIIAAYGTHFTLIDDPVPPAPPLSQTVASIPDGSPFVLALLSPHNEVLDVGDFDAALDRLTGGSGRRQDAPYQVWSGRLGRPGVSYRASDRPYRETVSIADDTLTVQMDGWLPFDTFRRGGFGHVMRGGRAVLTVERGVSLVWFTADGRPRVAYAAGLYAPRPRFRISPAIPQPVTGIANAMLRTAAPAE
jgi:hypothetical protein